MRYVLIVSMIAGLSTGLGALPLLFLRNISHRTQDALLGFASGIMIAASSFSLLLPALEEGGLIEVVAGLLAGALMLAFMEKVIPHSHSYDDPDKIESASKLRKTLLMVSAITLHNIPEGFAVGVAFAAGQPGAGLILAIAIAAQNAPEGLVVAAPLIQNNIKPWKAIALATATGLVEPIAAIFGYLAVSMVSAILPFSLAFAAGAMFYVVSNELIPESHGHGNENIATMGVIFGIIAMVIIEKLLG